MILHATLQTCWSLPPPPLFVFVNLLYFLFLCLSASADNYIPFTEKRLLIITYVTFLGTAAVAGSCAGIWLALLFILMVLRHPQWYSRWTENLYCMMKKRVCVYLKGNSGRIFLNTPERRCPLCHFNMFIFSVIVVLVVTLALIPQLGRTDG